MSEVWSYILKLLGPGLHWGRSQKELNDAILQAEKDEEWDAAGHLRIILEQRNLVMFDKKDPAG